MTDNEGGPPGDENHLIAERRAKLAKLRERGNPFPNDFRRNALAADLLCAYGGEKNDTIEAQPLPLGSAGRLAAQLGHWSTSFFERRNDRGCHPHLLLAP